MRRIIRIEPQVTLPERKKVAAYARVSMESERLAHSLAAQISYYSELIQRNPNWEYAGVYADNFVSGTICEKVVGLNQFDELIEKVTVFPDYLIFQYYDGKETKWER